MNKIVLGLFPYEAVHPDDLGFKKGEKMKILEEWVYESDRRFYCCCFFSFKITHYLVNSYIRNQTWLAGAHCSVSSPLPPLPFKSQPFSFLQKVRGSASDKKHELDRHLHLENTHSERSTTMWSFHVLFLFNAKIKSTVERFVKTLGDIFVRHGFWCSSSNKSCADLKNPLIVSTDTGSGGRQSHW